MLDERIDELSRQCVAELEGDGFHRYAHDNSMLPSLTLWPLACHISFNSW